MHCKRTNLLKTFKTKRKFYGKWLYRIGIKVTGISVIRNHGFSETISLLSNLDNVDGMILPNSRYDPYFFIPRSHRDCNHIIAVCEVLSKIDPQQFYKRLEYDHLGIYTNDRDLFFQIQTSLSFCVYNVSKPDLCDLDILSKANQIAVADFPHGKYRYKVYLQPHRLNNDRSAKNKFLDWVVSQEKISISQAVKNWFLVTDWNWDRRYVYVEDEHTLLMLKMRETDVVGKIYEYILTDK